ncbi:hypothetical protein QC761_0031480 [Podospora bellae-mahoneyi]|uniref:Uncharacterized protein n=1 Tax=Podospora bellae-mahoneyi TaxID=2093777 RepID=A0ABR0FNN5_9PEZI|nr:hypothetical protein QC761_0031480 [Podospora bellae-mahoneyi]
MIRVPEKIVPRSGALAMSLKSCGGYEPHTVATSNGKRTEGIMGPRLGGPFGECYLDVVIERSTLYAYRRRPEAAESSLPSPWPITPGLGGRH